MATKEQVMAGLGNIETELGKIGTETQTLIAKVAELQQAANNAGNIPDEVMDKINAVATQARVVDDLVPDATELPPAPTPDVVLTAPGTPVVTDGDDGAQA